jgi:hypothetical protein
LQHWLRYTSAALRQRQHSEILYKLRPEVEEPEAGAAKLIEFEDLGNPEKNGDHMPPYYAVKFMGDESRYVVIIEARWSDIFVLRTFRPNMTSFV